MPTKASWPPDEQGNILEACIISHLLLEPRHDNINIAPRPHPTVTTRASSTHLSLLQ